MKTKLFSWLSLVGIACAFLLPQNVEAAGACTSARFHDWQDLGCNQNNPGAGGVAKAQCPDCPGMPRWWVHEPYENVWMSDTPLSYTMSSGKEMTFEFYYRQRYKMPDSDEVPDGRNDPYAAARGLVASGYSANGMTNAAWGNNWMMAITFWDQSWETNWLLLYGPPNTYSVPSYPVFSDGYQALLFQPDGGMNYFTSTSLQDPQSLMRLQPVSSYPTITNNPSSDANGIYWGDPGIGFKINYPDGSQDVLGLTLGTIPTTVTSPNTPYGTSTSSAFLTQRIDPQGRVTRIGYERLGYTNYWPIASVDEPLGTYDPSYYGFRIKYVVDPDGRTNTFVYATMAHNNNPPAYPASSLWQLTEIDDPYGRKVQLAYDPYSGILTNITDAAGLSSSFQYAAGWTNYSYYYYPNPSNLPPMSVSYMLPNGGWITNLSTRYGNTTFSYYQLLDASGTDAYIQRAIYVSEPEGAHQLYYYLHNNPSAASSATAPTVPGQAFDDGNTGSYDPQLIHRNTYHWGRRQFEALSGTVQSALSGSLSNALTDLTAADFNKADMKHWLLSSIDDFSITEGLSSEQDPSPDAAGSIPGLRTWYDYPHKPSGEPELLGSDPQVSCIARTLPDGSYQYITYNYYPNTYPYIAVGLVSDNESTYSKPDGTVGVLTNWFNYSTNSIDLIGVSNSAGQSWNIGYNGNHEITSITNALNQVTTLSWDSLTFNLTDIQFPGGKSIALNYYPAPYPPYYPLTNTSALLQQITIEPEGRVFTVNNYSAGLPISISDDRGLSWTNTWDGLNRLTSTAYPDGTSISNVYYRLDLVAAKDRMTNWTYYGYDGLDHLSTVTNANSAVTTYSWCGCGSLTAILDAQLNTTTLNYDNQGNLTNITFPDFSSLTYQYDLAGRMTNVFDGAGRSLQVGYNNQGLATTFTGANGLLLQKIYDAVNRPIFVTDANGITVTNQYDAINELIKRTWPDNVSEGYGYNAAGLFAYTNRDQQVTLYGLDGAGRITTVTNANQEITQFAYDSLDNITNLVDGLLHTTVWQYNEYGWLTNKLDGRGSNVLRYAYNPNGWVTNRWTPEKGNTGYAYDNVGNILTIHYPLSTISYLYNALNWLTNMVDAVGSHNFGWTPIGLPQSESDAWTTNGYTYSQGLRTALSIGSWNQSYSYDSVWRMTNTVSPAGAFNYQFLTPGSYLPTSIALPNGANILNGFDSLARFQSTALNNYWGHTLDGYSYGLDALGLKTNIVRNLGLTTSSVDVGYDSIDQITSWLAQETNGTPRQNEQLGFGYDVADNLHFRTNNLLVQTFNVDAANELTNVSRTGTFTLSGATPAPATEITVNGSTAQTYGDFTFAATNLTLLNGNNTFTNIAVNLYGLKVTNTLTVNLPSSVTPLYDSNGNLTNDGLHSLAYDAENQLTNVFVANQWRSDFIYDGLNRRRIERDYSWSGAWVLTNETHFIYDGYLLVQERDTNNNVLVTYTRGLDLSGSLSDAGGIGGLLARTDGNGSTFYHADGSGNITALMDGSENIVGRYLYNPFGKLVGRWGTMASVNRMQFSSMPTYSWGVGYWGRFWLFDPQRWANNDPIGEAGGINMTVGMNNNPVNVVDPFGLYNPISGPNGSVGSGSGLADASVFFPAVPTFPPAFDFNTGQSDPISMMLLPQFPFLDDSSIQTDDDIFALLFPFLAPEVGAGSLLKPKCPPAAEGTTLSLDTATTWGRADTLADHFARHGADFGAQTADEYANMASQFLQDSQSAGLPTKIDSQGVIRVFDPQSGTFGSFNPNGTTRTFFVPNNPTTYWGTQPGTLVP